MDVPVGFDGLPFHFANKHVILGIFRGIGFYPCPSSRPEPARGAIGFLDFVWSETRVRVSRRTVGPDERALLLVHDESAIADVLGVLNGLFFSQRIRLANRYFHSMFGWSFVAFHPSFEAIDVNLGMVEIVGIEGADVVGFVAANFA